jgi:protocatechuate 3,4-dioxygenase, alpha subunit
MKPGQTPSQTIGPYFAYGLVAEQYGYPFGQIVSGVIAAQGERVTITGCVFDGHGEPIVDALVELWQVGAGVARQGTGTAGDMSFTFSAVKPPRLPGHEASHITVIVFMRGLLSHLYTRVYFADEAEANALDDVLMSLPEDRRATLLARPESGGNYRFDIHMQGDRETVFFDL